MCKVNDGIKNTNPCYLFDYCSKIKMSLAQDIRTAAFFYFNILPIAGGTKEDLKISFQALCYFLQLNSLAPIDLTRIQAPKKNLQDSIFSSPSQ